MRRFFFILFSLILFLFLFPQKASAACSLVVSPRDSAILAPDFSGEITVITTVGVDLKRTTCFTPTGNYVVVLRPNNDQKIVVSGTAVKAKDDKMTLVFKVDLGEEISIPYDTPPEVGPASYKIPPGKMYPGSWTITICTWGDLAGCNLKDQNNRLLGSVQVSVSSAPPPTPTPPPPNLPIIDRSFLTSCLYQAGSNVELKVTNIQGATNNIPVKYGWWWHGDQGIKPQPYYSDNNGSDFLVAIPLNETQQAGNRLFCFDIATSRRCSPGSQNSVMLEFTPSPPDTDIVKSSCAILNVPPPVSFPASTKTKDLPCGGSVSADGKCNEVDTAVGPIPTDTADFVGFILKLFLGLAGGIALLLIISSGYRLMVSQGNPEKIQEAKEVLTAAIVGLLFIIFSLVLLQTVGVDILKIPGFGK